LNDEGNNVVQDCESHKISYPSGGFVANSDIFLLYFLWALLGRKTMDERERGFTGKKKKKEGEEGIDEREFNELKL
jgi:hypothetical protein